MRVFLTGGTGFVGSEILRQLLEAGHTVRCLVRRGSSNKVEAAKGMEIHRGDVTRPESLEGGLQGCDALIHLVGIIREYPGRGVTFKKMHVEATRNVLAAARDQGIRRYVHMSANGTRAGAESSYHRTKWRAEELVRDSQLDWTIFRPSVIFGKDSEFVKMLADLVRKLPVVPVIGDGEYRMAPVAVSDVARAFVEALEAPEASGQAYPLCGPGVYSYNEILELIGEALGKRKVCKIHQPVGLVKPVVGLLENLSFFPLTKAQLTMLLEENICEDDSWRQAFAIEPKDFGKEIGKILR
ncbi:MAG: complex I NDUFA9 subunit family protein [Desulfuromonadales bacterium]|nr:complex I NDUFA9 subunit family protein [Desulfuromonadales bacterium]NIS43292.1 complex I NDUFA9 subunit family protein [Desulfuromonadales bacterium]